MTSRVLLLDLDRTLVDLQSYTDYGAALAEVEQLIGTWSGADVPETDWDRPTQACMAVLHSKLGDPRWYEVSDAIARHERAAIGQSVAMPTVPGALGILLQYPVAVVTLLPVDVATEVLAAHGIGVGSGQAVDVVVGRDASIRPKPWPDGLVVAFERLGGSVADAIMIGDSSWDEEAARRAGVGFIGVPSSATGFPPDVAVAATFAEAVERAVGE